MDKAEDTHLFFGHLRKFRKSSKSDRAQPFEIFLMSEQSLHGYRMPLMAPHQPNVRLDIRFTVKFASS